MPQLVFPKTAPEVLVPVILFDVVAYFGENLFAVISPNTGMTRSMELPENPDSRFPAYIPCHIEPGQVIYFFQYNAAILTRENGKWYYSRRKDGANKQPLAPNTVFEIMDDRFLKTDDWESEDD